VKVEAERNMKPTITFYRGRCFEIRELSREPPPNGTTKLPTEEVAFDENSLGELTFGMPSTFEERRTQNDDPMVF